MSRSNRQPLHLPYGSTSGTAWPLAQGAGATPAAGVWNLMGRGKLLLATSLYVAAFLWAYATIVYPNFRDEGFTLTWPGGEAMAWLMMMVLLPALILPYSLSRPSVLILWWLYLAAYVPSILVPALSLIMPFEELLPFQLTLLGCMAIFCWAASSRLLIVPQITIGPSVFWPALILAWLACLGCVFANAGMGTLVSNLASLFNGATEYTIRAAYRSEIQESGRGLGYVVGQLGGGFNLFLIAFGLLYRRRMCLIAGIVGQIVVFSLTGFKAALFSVFLLASVAVIMRRWRRSFGLALTAGLIATVLVCAIADGVVGNVFVSSPITRRVLMTPGLLTGFYFDHYSKVPPVGVGLPFVHDPLTASPANEIGYIYCGSFETNANANLWAMGFAKLGMLGIIGYTIVAAFLFWIYDSLSARHNLELAVLLVAVPAVELSNTLVTTVLVSEGGLLAALLLYLLPVSERGEGFQAELVSEGSLIMPTTATSE